MSGNTTTLTFGGDANALKRAAAQATDAVKGTTDTVTSGAQDMKKAAGEAKDYGARLGQLGALSAGLSSALDDAGGSVQALSDIQQRGKERAQQHARALQDMAEAAQDAREAQRDLADSVDDFARAQLDADTALQDGRDAQAVYLEAVRAHGAASAEAQRASLDVRSAQLDYNEATNAGARAQEDGRRALLDTKAAALDLADAQKEAHPTGLQKAASEVEAYGGALQGVIGTISLLALAHEALAAASLKSMAEQVASKIATMASAVAAGVATAAQWLWNVAMDANPIGLIVLAIAALVGAVIYIATKTTWFQTAWKVSWGAIKDAAGAVADAVKGYLNWIVSNYEWAWGRLKAGFSGLYNGIVGPFKSAFHYVVDAWNNTIGRLSWTFPSVMGFGGFSISAPRLPHFHTGGTVPGAPGQEVLAVLQAGETITPAGGTAGADRTPTVRVVYEGDPVAVAFMKRLVRIEGGGDVQLAFGS
jgi:hypothetical protein